MKGIQDIEIHINQSIK